MPLTGGPSDKFGNRYELWWTVSQPLRVLHGQAESIRIEPVSVLTFGTSIREPSSSWFSYSRSLAMRTPLIPVSARAPEFLCSRSDSARTTDEGSLKSGKVKMLKR
jgi:hypothetical protein